MCRTPRLSCVLLGSMSLLLALPALADNSYATNPLGMFFNNTFNNVADYQRPTAMLVSGNCNRGNAFFSQARAAGAEVLAYIDPVEMYDSRPCDTSRRFYSLNGREKGPTPALWPFPRYGQRINWPKTHMLDLRVGSPWADRVVAYVERLMVEDQVDGLFLDVVGARLWSKLADWKSWPQSEQDAWTEGCIDLVRRIDASRRRLNPGFILVNNNLWDRGDAAGFVGEQYVDGVVLEHPNFSQYHRDYAGRPFGNLGHRRVLIITRDDGEAREWANVQGVTNVVNQTGYGSPGPPLIAMHRLTDRSKRSGFGPRSN
jgi:hypothetical protein